MNEHIEAPRIFLVSLAHKIAASFVSTEEGSERGGGKTKQKHFVLSVGAVSRGRTTRQPHGAVSSVRLLVSLCFCFIKNTGNFRVERRKMLENP